ncbi:hypothetical protein [Vibrio vulnificus]|uniref:hypothetical protein n=1 Tax=Vibrio vulnificus TaxID=672 RepID=UPI0013EE7296|nr:hypothetical protein [Vibrio vulnificus]
MKSFANAIGISGDYKEKADDKWMLGAFAGYQFDLQGSGDYKEKADDKWMLGARYYL